MLFLQIWLLPLTLLVTATLLAFPLSSYIAWIMEGRYQPCSWFAWVEKKLDTGAQTWKQYATSLLVFNTVLFVFGYLVLSLQPYTPFNPDHKTLLSPTTIFHSVASFMTNTDLQHYAGEVHLSNFSQVFFCITNFFLSASIGLCALMAIIRALRADLSVGSFFVDMWRAVIYLFVPLAFCFAILFVQQGCPMTFTTSYQALTLEKGTPQTIALGPVAAFEAMKMLGTNGGGFFGANSSHPFENPTGLSNFFNTLAMMILPFSLVLTYGKMLGRKRHSLVIFSVMLFLMISSIVGTVVFDTLRPNPALTAHPQKEFQEGTLHFTLPEVIALPVDQHLGNLEGKELRFGTSAGSTFAAITTAIACGAVNMEPDSLNPIASVFPMIGMWLNCIFGGKGVGMINMLLFIIIGIFIAGMMVGRSPEYLGKKIGAKEVKLAIIALLVHPFMILIPTGLFSIKAWGLEAISNPGAHGFSEILYQFSSASANNGSAFDGLQTTYGFFNNPHPNPEAMAWDIATGLVMIFARLLPLLAPLAMAATLGAKKPSPRSFGTLRNDTVTFGCLLLGTIVILGALLFLPVAALGPLAEKLGPIPFGEIP